VVQDGQVKSNPGLSW